MASHQRVSWPQYFMRIAHLVAERSTCLRRRVGAVAVKDKRILATGYNGAPAGIPHCLEIGCLRQQLGIPSGQRHEICRGLPCGTECHHPGCDTRHISGGFRTLLHYKTLFDLYKDVDKLRYPEYLAR